MESATSLTPPSTGLSDFQFSIPNVLESLIPKDQKKYNNTEMKSGRLFTAPGVLVDIIHPCSGSSIESPSLWRSTFNNKAEMLQYDFKIFIIINCVLFFRDRDIYPSDEMSNVWFRYVIKT